MWSRPSDGRRCHISSHACEACDSTDFLPLDVEGTKLPFSLGLCALICRRLLRVFQSAFPTYPSLPALKPKPNVSHTTDFCIGFVFFTLCLTLFLMWFADGPNPSGALVKWEVVFTTQHLHNSVQTKPKEEMNAVVSIHTATWKKTMQVVVTSSQSFILVTSDSTPELNNSFAPIEASESMSNSRVTPLVHSDLNLRFLNSIKCNSAHESPPVSWWLSHCLLFFPLQQSNVHVLLFVHPTKARHLIPQIYSPPPLHDQHFKCSLLCKSLITSLFQK